MTKYFYLDGVNKLGPFTKEQLVNENINRDTKIWYYGLDDWTNISDIDDLKEVFNCIPPDLKFEDHQVENESFTNQKSQNKELKKTKNKKTKWFIIALIVIILAFISFKLFEIRNNNDMYENISTSSYESDVDFQIYVDKFYRDLDFYGIYPKKPKKTIIKFSKLDQLDDTTHIHGISYGIYDDDLIEIYINPSSWKSFNKPMRYFLMYHELTHDILNLEDLDASLINEGELMYPAISTYENKDMDNFIESFHKLFEEISKSQN